MVYFGEHGKEQGKYESIWLIHFIAPSQRWIQRWHFPQSYFSFGACGFIRSLWFWGVEGKEQLLYQTTHTFLCLVLSLNYHCWENVNSYLFDGSCFCKAVNTSHMLQIISLVWKSNWMFYVFSGDASTSLNQRWEGK